MSTSQKEGNGAETQDRGYTLRFGRRVQYVSPASRKSSKGHSRVAEPTLETANNSGGEFLAIVGVVPESAPHIFSDCENQDSAPLQPSQLPLFENGHLDTHQQDPPTSGLDDIPQDGLMDLKKQIGSSILRCERLNHHLNFLKDCQGKNVIPKGLLLEKTINPVKGCEDEKYANINEHIKQILFESSKKIVNKLVDYYDQAVIDEHNHLSSLNDKLASLGLKPEQLAELDSFEADVSLRKETMRTKLEKRRNNKLQKLLAPAGTDQPRVGGSTQPPKEREDKKNKRKNRKKKGKKGKKNIQKDKNPKDHQKNKTNNNNTDKANNTDKGNGRVQEERGPDPPNRSNNNDDTTRQEPGRYYENRGYRPPYRPGGYRDDRRYDPQSGRDQNYHGSYYRPRYYNNQPRYFDDHARSGRNYGGQPFRSESEQVFRNTREETRNASLTVSDVLRLLVREGVLRN